LKDYIICSRICNANDPILPFCEFDFRIAREIVEVSAIFDLYISGTTLRDPSNNELRLMICFQLLQKKSQIKKTVIRVTAKLFILLKRFIKHGLWITPVSE